MSFWVRKHRAPKGALRLLFWVCECALVPFGQKAPSAKRCIKTGDIDRHVYSVSLVRKHRAPKGALRPEVGAVVEFAALVGQKAPSAKRCIKTRRARRWCTCGRSVRKHRAPKGALRRSTTVSPAELVVSVRKHRAPKGALRPPCPRRAANGRSASESTERQKVH